MKLDISLDGGKRVSTVVNGKRIQTDQPVQSGGEDSAPSPFDLFLASIGTCVGFFVKAFCDQRGIAADGIHITEDIHWNAEQHRVDKIDMHVSLPDSFPEKYRNAVLQAASGCTVKKHLFNPPEIAVELESILN